MKTTWDAVAQAVNYEVSIAGAAPSITNVASYDFSDYLKTAGVGSYTYTVKAKASEESLWLDSASSATQTITYGAHTKPATAITQTTALVSGEGLANVNTVTAIGIEYATMADFSNKKVVTIATADATTIDTAKISFSTELTELAPNTTYYYKVYIEEGSARYEGLVERFTTLQEDGTQPEPTPEPKPEPTPTPNPAPTPSPGPGTNPGGGGDSGSGGTTPSPTPTPEQPQPAPVEPTPEPAQPIEPKPTISFSDIEKSWAKEAIEEMAALGVIQGYPDGTFRPNEAVKRKHIALMLSRLLDLEPKRGASAFQDVPTTHPYYEVITKLQRAGVIDGSDGAFNPEAPMTRAQLAKVLVLAFDIPLDGTTTFQDVPSTHWSTPYIATLADRGIVLGDNGRFKPNEPVTRAQFAAFLSRTLAQSK